MGEKRGIVVVDDYGHHPTEIRVTLEAARAVWSGRLVVIFQPHRYSRTHDLLDEFANAFEQADVLYVTPIYAAGETSIDGVSSEILAERIRTMGHPAVHWVEKQDVLVHRLVSELRSGDTVLTLGAGERVEGGGRVVGVGVSLWSRLPGSGRRVDRVEPS